MAEPVDTGDTGDTVDFAVAAYRSDGRWEVHEISHDHLVDVDTLVHALRRFDRPGGVLALVGYGEDFFLIVRVVDGETRLMLSDVLAAEEWDLAESAAEALGLPSFEDLDDDDIDQPAGDLGLLTDLGVGASALAELVDDVEMYNYEMVSEVAMHLGFGDLFDDAVGLAPA